MYNRIIFAICGLLCLFSLFIIYSKSAYLGSLIAHKCDDETNSTWSFVLGNKDPDISETSDTFHKHDLTSLSGVLDGNDTGNPLLHGSTDRQIDFSDRKSEIAPKIETKFSKIRKETLRQILDDLEQYDMFETPLGLYALLGKISNANQVVSYVNGTGENPLKSEARALIQDQDGTVTLGPSIVVGMSSGSEGATTGVSSSGGTSSSQSSGPTNWGIPGLVQASIEASSGNMQVSWNGSGMYVKYLGTSSLESQSNESLIYNIGGNDKRVIMGMNQKVEELILKNNLVEGNYNTWYQLDLQSWVKYICLTEMGHIELRDGNDNSVMKVGKPEAIDSSGNAVQCWWTVEQIDAATVQTVTKPGSQQAWSITEGSKIILKLTTDMGSGEESADFPVVIDPAWSTGGALGNARRLPGLYPLTNGKIIAVGGFHDADLILSSCEL
ncbi:MAG: hypothetical protein HY606_01545 [Planctomycetes bacterium]|nr:hypothetical protein [Planctomycetota bacterium]